MKLKCCLLKWISILSLGICLSAQAATNLYWSSDINVSNLGVAPGPSLQVVGDDNFHAVATWTTSAGNIYAAYLPRGSQTWQVQSAVFAGLTTSNPVSIAMNQNGQGIIAFDNGTGVRSVSFTIQNNSISWSSNQVVSAAGLAPSIAIDGSGNAFAVWINTASSQCGISYRPSGSGTWTTQSSVGGSVTVVGSQVDIAVNATGQGIIVFNDSLDNMVSYTFTYASNTFSLGSQEFVVPSGQGHTGHSCAVDKNGNAVTTVNSNVNGYYIAFFPQGAGSWTSFSSYYQLYDPLSPSSGVASVEFASNANGASAVLYQGVGSGDVYSRGINTLNQTVLPIQNVAVNATPVGCAVDSFGDIFGSWTNPTQTAYIGGWSPSGSNQWRSSGQITNQSILSPFTADMAVTSTGQGVLVYAGTNDIFSVLFSIGSPPGPPGPGPTPIEILSQQALLRAGSKYANNKPQKGVAH